MRGHLCLLVFLRIFIQYKRNQIQNIIKFRLCVYRLQRYFLRKSMTFLYWGRKGHGFAGKGIHNTCIFMMSINWQERPPVFWKWLGLMFYGTMLIAGFTKWPSNSSSYTDRLFPQNLKLAIVLGCMIKCLESRPINQQMDWR